MSLKLKELKKYLEDQTKNELLKEIVYLAKQFPEVQEYYHIKINPQLEGIVFEKYKKIIADEFSVDKNNPTMGYSAVNKAIRDFRKVTENVNLVAELMLYYVEVGVNFTVTFGDIDQKFYTNIEKAFMKALEYIYKHDLIEKFKDKVNLILDAVPEIGWGFQESMIDIYYQYYEDEEIIIRQETKEDVNAVYKVTKSAFEKEEYSNHDEHNLVNRLRKSQYFIPQLSLVAEVGGEIVGHILFTKIKIGEYATLALGPISVLPQYQGIGIGSNLILFGHHVARELGYVSVIVLGHPTFYPRFGYIPASKWNIKPPFDVPDENFMAVELLPNSLQEVSGIVEYPAEFLVD